MSKFTALKKALAKGAETAAELSAKAADELPMDEASRLARAKEMGFDTDKVYYHGTNAAENFEAFDPKKQTSGRFSGTYLSENSNVDNFLGTEVNDPSGNKYFDYRKNARIIPTHVSGKIFDINSSETNNLIKDIIKENPQYYNYSPTYQDSLLSEKIKNLGYSGIKNGSETIVFDPKKVRSKFAEFDPAKKDSAKLSAGLAGAGIGTAAMLGDSEEANAAIGAPLAKISKFEQLAKLFNKEKGLAVLPEFPYQKVNPELGTRIAKAYDEMPHAPNDENVKRAYDALIKETLEQYQKLKESGLKIEPIKPGQPNPYAGGSADMIKDMQENNHLWYYPTEQGFGTDPTQQLDHPLLAKTGEKIGDQELVANDLFRIVHDIFGHAKEGVGFGARGEENAFQAHMRMFSPEAQKALATETRGQNSWVNFGPKGAENRANPANTTYATQKAGILPDWAINEGRYDTQASSIDGKKAAALTGVGLGTAAMLGDSEDAEASTKVIPRQLIEKFLKESTQDGVLNTPKLLELMQIEPLKFRDNLRKTSDLLGHVALERLGLPEDQYMEALRRMYPEVDLIRGGVSSAPLDPGVQGKFSRPVLFDENNNYYGSNPKSSEIVYSPDLENYKTSLVSTLLHEGQHLKDSINYPLSLSTPIPSIKLDKRKMIKTVNDDPRRVYDVASQNPQLLQNLVDIYNSNPKVKKKLTLEEFQNQLYMSDGTLFTPQDMLKLASGNPKQAYGYFDNPNLSREELLQQFTGNHHIEFPKNFELEKAKELVEQGNVNVTDVKAAAKKLNELEKTFQKNHEELMGTKFKKAAAITGAATGASMLNSEDAEAAPRFRQIKRIFDKTSDMTGKGLMASAALAPAAEGPISNDSLVEPGNIDLNSRTKVKNSDGSYSTVRTMTITTDKGAINIPTVIGDKVVSEKEAVDHFRRTGQHLGIYKNVEEATKAAEKLHDDQANLYDGVTSSQESEINQAKKEEATLPTQEKKPKSWFELFNKASQVRKPSGSYYLDNPPEKETGLEPFEAVGEIVDRTTTEPFKAATLAALEGKNPITAAKEGFMGKKTQGDDIAHNVLEKAESVIPRESFLNLFMKKDSDNKYLLEKPLGFVADMGIDATNLMGVGLGKKALEGAQKFNKIKNLFGR